MGGFGVAVVASLEARVERPIFCLCAFASGLVRVLRLEKARPSSHCRAAWRRARSRAGSEAPCTSLQPGRLWAQTCQGVTSPGVSSPIDRTALELVRRCLQLSQLFASARFLSPP